MVCFLNTGLNDTIKNKQFKDREKDIKNEQNYFFQVHTAD